MYTTTLHDRSFTFATLKALLACASEEKTGDVMAGIAATTELERIAARRILADLPLSTLYENPVIAYDTDEVTRVMIDAIDATAYGRIKDLTVGAFRELILASSPSYLASIRDGITAEMASATAKLMSNLDLVYAAAKLPVTATCNTTIGLPGTFSVRCQPNHPTDDVAGILASTAEGLSYGCGDAVIGVNPATDDPDSVREILTALRRLVDEYAIPTQNCVLAHVSTQMAALASGAPVDLMFQSIAGSQRANAAFGIDVALLDEADHMMRQLKNSTGPNYFYFETGQGSALSADGHHGADQQTLEARAYSLAKRYRPFLVNTVVGFIGPEYLYDGRQIIRAGLEDHFMGKLLGVPAGVDVCYTNHARADQNDVDVLVALLAQAGCNYIMGIPTTDDVMLAYQSSSFHDTATMRELLGKHAIRPFEHRMEQLGVLSDGRLTTRAGNPRLFGYDPPTTHTANTAQATQSAGEHVPTPARLDVGHAGPRLRTATLLDLRADHAIARDAVWDDTDCSVADDLGFVTVQTLVNDKEEYLRRPDLARGFSDESLAYLRRHAAPGADLQIIAADGLSVAAVQENLARIYPELIRLAGARGYSTGTPIYVRYGRVATMDKISEALQAKVTVLLVGERPGLGCRTSMSCYMAWEASPDKPEAQRNVVSNIHDGGLPPEAAAERIISIAADMFRYRTSGVELNRLLHRVAR